MISMGYGMLGGRPISLVLGRQAMGSGNGMDTVRDVRIELSACAVYHWDWSVYISVKSLWGHR